MLRQLLSIFIAVAFTLTAAHADAGKGLKEAFDEMDYALNVEWDQKDIFFQELAAAKFQDKVNSLMAQGLSKKDLLTLIRDNFKNESFAIDLEKTLNLISISHLTSKERANLIADILKKDQANGSSWNGEAVIPAIGLLLVVAILIASVAVFNHSQYACSDGSSLQNKYLGTRSCYTDADSQYICEDDYELSCASGSLTTVK